MKVKAETFNTVQAAVKFINENNIKRDDILSIIDKEQQLFLIYYMS